MAENLTAELLEQIRDEIRGTNARVDQTNERLERFASDLGSRIDQTNERLERVGRRQVESETRLSTEIVAVVGAVDQVRDLLRDNLALSPRIDDHERRIRKLERHET